MRSLLLALLLVPGLCRAQAPPAAVALPHSAQAKLDKKYPGWKFVPVSDEIRQYFKQDLPGARPDLIAGDFDGNGQTDYAVLIEHGIITGANGKPIGRRAHLLAFLQRKQGFKLYVVDDEGGGEYLTLARKGTQGYDYETQQNFIYQHDTISTGIFEKAGSSYLFEHGRFRVIITSD